MDITVAEEFKKFIETHGLKEGDLKQFFREAVREHWPSFPSFSSYKIEEKNGPMIPETPTASIGSGVVLTWLKNGVRKVFLGQTGEHYAELYRRNPKNTEPFPVSFTIPGGFMTLAYTKGSSLVPASNQPENGYTAAAREIEEEFRDAEGNPLLKIDPSRLKMMDTASMGGNGNYMTVMGLTLELTDEEIEIVETHVARLETDPAYKEACALATKNDDTGLPEISDKKIFDLEDIVAGKVNIFHKDQHSLFAAVKKHFDDIEQPKKRVGPTLAVAEKVKTLEELKALVDGWRANTNASIGITSGAFDVLHPGHISFLNDCSRDCGRLILIVASSRTIKEQKGDEKPIFNEYHRAQSLAALQDVDAVIISDSYYHEEILEALKPDVMYKGDDYQGKEIYGSELVGRIAIIPCAEDKFFHSSQVIKEIQSKKPVEAAPALT